MESERSSCNLATWLQVVSLILQAAAWRLIGVPPSGRRFSVFCAPFSPTLLSSTSCLWGPTCAQLRLFLPSPSLLRLDVGKC